MPIYNSIQVLSITIIEYFTTLNFVKVTNQSSTKKTASFTEILLGKEEDFSFEHRIFNMICVITLAILIAFLLIDVLINASQSLMLVTVLLVIQLAFYGLSRRMHKYKTILFPYILTVYTGLATNYFFNAGLDGPTLLLFFTTLQLVLNLSVRRRYVFWITISALLPGILVMAEYFYPYLVSGRYEGKVPKIIDLLSCYILSIIYIFFATSSFKKHLFKQQEKEKESQQAIMEYGFRLRAFFESLDDRFMLLDKNMHILYFNKSAEELSVKHYGRRMEEQMDIRLFLHETTSKLFIACFDESLKGVKVQQEFKRDYNGEIVWWQNTFNPAKNDAGEIIGVTVIMKDITEAQLYKLHIERKNELLEKIAFIQAHELRGPLTSVQGLLALIKEEYCDMDLIYTKKLEEGLTKLDDKIKEIIALSSAHRNETPPPDTGVK